MRAVDTNVLVRLVARDDGGQVEAAEKFVAQGAFVSHLVLAETVWVLDAVYGLAAREIVVAIDMLLNHRSLVVQDADVVRAALEHFRTHPALGFSNCLVVETARKFGHLPMGTFDRGRARLDGVERIR